MSVQKQRHTVATSDLDSDVNAPADTIELELRYYSSTTEVDIAIGASEWTLTFGDDGALKRGKCEGPRAPKWLPEAVNQVEPGLKMGGAY